MRGSEPDLSICAKQAIAFLHKYLLTDHPGIRGQRVDQYLPGTNLSQVTNDDKILECCRFAQANLTENVLMLSNDKNLCVKAHIHGVGTVSQYKGSPEALVGEIGQQFGLPNMKIVPYHPIPKRNRPQPVSNGHGHEPVAAPVGLISDDDVLMGDADEVKRDHSDKEFDSDGMDVDEQGNPIYPVRAPPYQDPSDPMEVVCNGLVDMLLGCMPPSLTTLLRRNLGRLAPEPPKRWSIQLIADTLHDNRHTAFHKVLSDRFFSEDLPFLKRTAKDLDRGKERNRVLVTKGELLKLMDIGVRLVDCCSGAGFPDDRDRALRLLRGMKETLA
ncbi:hypothetical protein HK097_011614 [Rhizophlyctis rosea]|uniref:PIN domain-containing protein n=1 Tax=Rhizophlyctis rosea TaxID=64517 RepID=A0AAD5SHJ1_9FUNG|nr:hypothetical protein HK097_011614 [Rhizophlyctis rosea]